jgi:hypothetical protein
LTNLGAQMSANLDELVADVSEAADTPPLANGPEIRARADEAIFGPIPVKTAEEGSALRPSLLPKRILGYGLNAALVAFLVGFGWLAGLYFSGDQPSHFVRKLWALWSVAPQESAEQAETSRMNQKMAEEIRALKADVEAMHATQGSNAQDTAALEGLSTQLSLTKTEASAATAELAGKVEQLERESAAKFSQIYERFDRIEHPITAPTTASPAAASESGATVAKNRARGKRHDAFNPSQNPNAPGVPRPLGSPVD